MTGITPQELMECWQTTQTAHVKMDVLKCLAGSPDASSHFAERTGDMAASAKGAWSHLQARVVQTALGLAGREGVSLTDRIGYLRVAVQSPDPDYKTLAAHRAAGLLARADGVKVRDMFWLAKIAGAGAKDQRGNAFFSLLQMAAQDDVPTLQRLTLLRAARHVEEPGYTAASILKEYAQNPYGGRAPALLEEARLYLFPGRRNRRPGGPE